jgi:transcriptional regulator with XRE-family HTH domain
VDLDDARTIGRRVRQIRYAGRKSLRMVTGLAGTSKSKLHRIKCGEVALDSLSNSVALANRLQIALSELGPRGGAVGASGGHRTRGTGTRAHRRAAAGLAGRAGRD